MKTERNTVPAWLMAALLGLSIIHVTGCATESEGSAAMKQQALSFNPPPGQAAIYVIRPYSFLDWSVTMRVSLDYQDFGGMKTRSYLFAPLSPGQHVLRNTTGSFEDPQIVPFLAEAGKNYFFSIEPGREIKPISALDGKSYVQKFELSGDNRFDFQSLSGQNQQ